MYAVIKTGGKQYRVKPGDVLVIEKLSGEAGAEVAFDQVLMLGEGSDVTVGAPLIEGALVKATLVETRKGEKVKVFKKIRRQGYRRTRGHRQPETVLRVTSVAGQGKSESWDGTVDLTTRAVLNARARNLTSLVASLEGRAEPAKPVKAEPKPVKVKTEPKPAKAKAAPKAAEPKPEAAPATEAVAEAAKPAKAVKAKPAAPKAPTKADAKPKASAKAAPARPAPKAARPKGKG